MDISWPMTYLESGTKDFPNPFNKEVALRNKHIWQEK